jgi:rhodanese-related sulfurtransferase
VISRSRRRPGSVGALLVVATLVGLGYTNVWEFDGGMIAWEKAGYQLVQRPQS